MSGRLRISMTVNGQEIVATVEPRRTLADFLREDLGLTGTHVGCEHGVCGSCTVLVDGVTARSCIVYAVQLDGGTVETVESLAPGGELHPIMEAMLECHGLQCGFCTPGFVMTIFEFLSEVTGPDETTTRKALAGNLCRCTGYDTIIDAVLRADDLWERAVGATDHGSRSER